MTIRRGLICRVLADLLVTSCAPFGFVAPSAEARTGLVIPALARSRALVRRSAKALVEVLVTLPFIGTWYSATKVARSGTPDQFGLDQLLVAEAQTQLGTAHTAVLREADAAVRQELQSQFCMMSRHIVAIPQRGVEPEISEDGTSQGRKNQGR